MEQNNAKNEATKKHIGEIVDLTTICNSFPEISICNGTDDFTIQRDNIITAIDEMFDEGIQVVGIEGEEGLGKTTLLAQYSRRHSDNAISIFIKSSSKWGFDPLTIQFDICNQLNWFFYKQTIPTPDYVSDTYLRNHLLSLQQRCRIYKQTFIFVIDGLEDIPIESQEIRELILDMLPFGMTSFKFLLSTDPDILPEKKRKGLIYKPFRLVGFTKNEVEKFFSEISLCNDDLDEIYKTCKGIPGKLSSVKRIIKSGINMDSFINDLPNKMPDLFEMEWNNVSYKGEDLQKILAVIAFDDNNHDISFIAKLFNTSGEQITRILKEVSFICIEPNNNEVNFVSTGFKNFARTKLMQYKDEVNDLIIDYLVSKPESEENLKFLPEYLEKAGKHNEVIQYLSPERFDEMLKKIQSIRMIEQMVDLGLEVSEKLCRDGDIIRFGLQKSTIKEFYGAETWHSEIEALMALKDYDSAMTLTQTTILKEDRLHLLAIIARKKKEHGLTPEPELIDQIRNLYKQIDIISLGERVVDIAIDLIFSVPDIAIELIESAEKSNLAENSFDWALTSLTISTITEDSQLRRADILENLSTKIKSPVYKRFAAGAKLLLGKYSGSEVISEVEKLENTGERLYLLCQWVISNREHEDAYNVIDYALKLAFRTTAYAPNAKMFRDLASALPYIIDGEKVKSILAILDSQKLNIEHNGPTEDYVALQLLLSEAQAKTDFMLFKNRIVDLYLFICYIEEFDTKVNCLARFVSSLEKIDPHKQLEKIEKLHTLACDDLENSLSLLLSSSAEHFEQTKSIIYSLGRYKPDFAFNLASLLNTITRRDLAYYELINTYIKLPIEQIDFTFTKKVLDTIHNKDINSLSLIKIIERICTVDKITEEIIERYVSLIKNIIYIPNLSERCRMCCLAYSALRKNKIEKYKDLENQLLKILRMSWEGIDVSWEKINVGFKIVESMADYSIDIAKEYYGLTDDLRDHVIFDSSSSALTYITCIRLAIRAYSGLLPKGLNTNSDIERLSSLIKSIPSSGEQVELWSYMAQYCFINNKLTEFHMIYDNNIKPLLESISKDDVYYLNQTKCNIAPTIYIAHKLSAFKTISELPLPDRDIAYLNICEFVLNNKLPNEPYDELTCSGKKADYSNLLDVCEILEHIEIDCLIYNIISDIAECVVNNKTVFTREQKSDVAAKLIKIINEKLPNENYIKHNGYKIIAYAQVYRISKPDKGEWDKLVNMINDIPNSADKSFVICVIASIMTQQPLEKRKDLVREAKNIIDSIPSVVERINHYEVLSSLVWNVDSAMCKDSLTLAFKSSLGCQNENLFSTQRRLIDLSYRLDPDLAASLASITDDDMARSEIVKNSMKDNIKRRYELLKAKKSFMDQSLSLHTVSLDKLDYVKLMWMMLGTLNSDRTSPLHIQKTREYMKKAYGLSLFEAYPAYAWAIQNSIKRLSDTDQSSTILRPIFEAAMLGAEFAKRLAVRISATNKKTINYLSRQVCTNSILIKSGDRELAIKFIKNWMENNVKDYLKICDPYFGLEELDVLKYLKTACPDCRVFILTSIKHLKKSNIIEPWNQTFKDYWRMKISDQDPPDTDIYVIGTKSQGGTPFHDRWWITNGGGLRVGTSFNSLGISKSSEISVLSENESILLNLEIEQYINRTKRDHNGEKLEYVVFTLL